MMYVIFVMLKFDIVLWIECSLFCMFMLMMKVCGGIRWFEVISLFSCIWLVMLLKILCRFFLLFWFGVVVILKMWVLGLVLCIWLMMWWQLLVMVWCVLFMISRLRCGMLVRFEVCVSVGIMVKVIWLFYDFFVVLIIEVVMFGIMCWNLVWFCVVSLL